MDSVFGHKLPISAIIPTCDRYNVLKKTLQSISEQSVQPSEIIIIDASYDDLTYNLCKSGTNGLISHISWYKADVKGAAAQRNQGTSIAQCNYILYIDDDIILEKDCLENLWNGLNTMQVGGVGAVVMNQLYHKPGLITRFMYQLMSGVKLESYAGKCIGPAWNLWPEYHEWQPKCVNVEWLSTVCVLYPKVVLPQPVFPDIFKGYSYMEDVYLSLTVAKTNGLFIVTDAKIIHDSQPGGHKNSIYKISKMQFVNRHYIMRNVMERKSFKDYCKLVFLEFFMVLSHVRHLEKIIPYFFGKVAGCFFVVRHIK